MSDWSLEFEGGDWISAALLLALTFQALRRYPLSDSWRRQNARFLLVGLRAIAVAGAAFLLLQPSVVLRGERTERFRVLLLIDQSRSMRLPAAESRDSKVVPSRASAVEAALARESATLNRLRDTCDLAVMGFDSGVHALDQEPGAPRGSATGIAAALAAAGTSAANWPDELLLISDGAENVSSRDRVPAAARDAAARGTRLTFLGVGDASARVRPPLLVIRDFDVPRVASPGSKIDLAATVESAGLAAQEINLELCWDDAVVATAQLRPPQSPDAVKVQLSCVAEGAGFHRVTLRAASPAGSAKAAPSAADGRQEGRGVSTSDSRVVQVRGTALRVLLVESRPRQEAAFVLRALAGDERLEVQARYLGHPPEGEWSNSLPRDVEEWRRYSLVILGDLARREMRREQLAALQEAVAKHGVGLIGLAGRQRFELFRSAPLADTSPTVIPSDGNSIRAALVPTATGLRTAPMQLGSLLTPRLDDTAAWRSLGETAATSLGSPKATTDVWLGAERETPLIAAIASGRGRCALVGILESWRWRMGSEQGRGLHDHFWRQLALWAANPRPAAYVQSDRAAYERVRLLAGMEQVVIEAAIDSPRIAGESQPPLRIRVSRMASLRPSTMPASPASRRAGPVELTLPFDGQLWHSSFRPSEAGSYRIELLCRTDVPVPASRRAAEVGTNVEPEVLAESVFLVNETDLESLDPDCDEELLRSCAAAAEGGEYQSLNRLGGCLENILRRLGGRRVSVERRWDVVETTRVPLFLLVLAALAAEWSLRRRLGGV